MLDNKKTYRRELKYSEDNGVQNMGNYKIKLSKFYKIIKMKSLSKTKNGSNILNLSNID